MRVVTVCGGGGSTAREPQREAGRRGGSGCTSGLPHLPMSFYLLAPHLSRTQQGPQPHGPVFKVLKLVGVSKTGRWKWGVKGPSLVPGSLPGGTHREP